MGIACGTALAGRAWGSGQSDVRRPEARVINGRRIGGAQNQENSLLSIVNERGFGCDSNSARLRPFHACPLHQTRVNCNRSGIHVGNANCNCTFGCLKGIRFVYQTNGIKLEFKNETHTREAEGQIMGASSTNCTCALNPEVKVKLFWLSLIFCPFTEKN